MTSVNGDHNPEQDGAGDFAGRLLDWYDVHHREFPWRIAPSGSNLDLLADPYRVWLSEIMLQQTTVEAVKPYFTSFVARWPTVDALAAADTDAVMKAWAGLGYYSRARNLKKCADIIVSAHGGRFPSSETELKTLPGIGDYTAAAIAAIAFARPAAVVDGNIERVVCRHEAIETPLPGAKKPIRAFVRRVTPNTRPGDFAQAMMDLGAMICTPKRPGCDRCPLRTTCRARQGTDPEFYPQKPVKAKKPLRRTAVFVAVREDGAILLRKRRDKGLLAGMSEVPNSGFTSRSDGDRSIGAAPFAASWKKTGTATHVFTHFRLELTVFRCDVRAAAVPPGWWWSEPHAIGSEALPTVMHKAIGAAGIRTGRSNLAGKSRENQQ